MFAWQLLHLQHHRLDWHHFRMQVLRRLQATVTTSILDMPTSRNRQPNQRLDQIVSPLAALACPRFSGIALDDFAPCHPIPISSKKFSRRSRDADARSISRTSRIARSVPSTMNSCARATFTRSALRTLAIRAGTPFAPATSEGFTYYFPALARLALAEPDYVHGWYGTVLLFHLVGDGRRNRRFMACTPGQRRAVVQLLQHFVETRAAVADEHCSTDDLFRALEIWSDDTPVA